MLHCLNRHKKLFLSLVMVLTILLFVKPFSRLLYPQEYNDYVHAYARAYDVPSDLLFAVIRCESSFRREAVSKAGACGLMQLTEPTFRDICLRLELPENCDIFSAQINIQCGAYYLRYLFDRYGNWSTALAAYNAGLGNVDAWLDDQTYSTDGKTLTDIPFAETKAHVKKVLATWKIYKELYKE